MGERVWENSDFDATEEEEAEDEEQEEKKQKKKMTTTPTQTLSSRAQSRDLVFHRWTPKPAAGCPV